jgi:D-3-phosphoglycerate dehydrogenase / 2-oxoglutarate reductase
MPNRTACLIDALPMFAPFSYEQETLARAGVELRVAECRTTEDVPAYSQGAEVIMSMMLPITRDLLAALPDCRLVMRWAVGYNTVDVDAATELGVAVTNCPTWCTEEVADHAAALILAARRNIALADRLMRAGTWAFQEYRPLRRLPGRTLGLVGFGRIGRATARKLSGFGFRVLAADPFLSAEFVQQHGAELVDLDTLLSESDIVSVHTPLTAGTRHLFGEAELRRMKPTATLVNTARGPIIDEAALTRALQEGWIAHAALDVFEEEPLNPASLLLTLPNVTLTPHMAGYSDDALVSLRQESSDIVIRWFKDGWATTVVNPEVRDRLRPRTR